MEQHGLTVLDYSVLGVILLSGLLALMRGFVREMLSLIAWALAYFIAANYYNLIEPWTHKYIKSDTGAIALAGVILFVLALTVFTLIGYLIAKLIRGRALTAIDRSLGFLFGLVRGALIVSLIYLGATYIPWLNLDKLDGAQSAPPIEAQPENPPKTAESDKDKPPEWLINSKTRPAMAYGAHILKDFVPEKELEKKLKEYDDKASSAATSSNHIVGEKVQDMLGIPGHSPEKKDDQSPYNNQSRSNLDQLIGEKSK